MKTLMFKTVGLIIICIGFLLGTQLSKAVSRDSGIEMRAPCENMGCSSGGPECVETQGQKNCAARPEGALCIHMYC